MTFDELEQHVGQIDGLSIESLVVGNQTYLVIKNVRIPGGNRGGQLCEVALLRSIDNPWLPEPKIHVRPHLVPMGQMNSQASPVGPEWQYLSRRYDRHPPTARSFYAHILTVLGEL